MAAAVMAASSVSVTEIWVGLSFGIALHLSLIGLSQADDSPLLATFDFLYAQ
jgi:hypothetical protein